MGCKDCLNRREFFARSAVAAAALAAIEGCGDGQIGTAPTTLGAGTTIRIADFPGLANVGTIVDVGNNRAIVRTGASTFLGLSRLCTHEQFPTVVRNNQLQCDNHGSIFSATGDVIRGPSTGERIPALQKLNVAYDPQAGTLKIG